MTTTAAPEPHGLLIVDKAKGPTSHDVVAIARRALGTRAIGHTGTLDPMATGVLVLAVGEATKLVNVLGASDKRYDATLTLGSETNTLDAEGEVVREAPVPPLTLSFVREVSARFWGEIDQEVPRVSAVKVGGRPLHKLERKGRDFAAPVRRVVVHALDICAVRAREIDFSVHSGKGFYVRSLARDLAHALGTVGHLSMLRRTHNGPFTLARAVDFERLRQAARAGEEGQRDLRSQLIPFDAVCAALPHVMLDDAAVAHARHGRAFPLTHVVANAARLSDTEPTVALDTAQRPIALVVRSGHLCRVVRGFRGV